jgi:hypothetical protein
MDFNLGLVIIIAVVMMLLYGFLDLLRSQVTTGVWDVGMLAATGIYSLAVGLIAGFSGVLNLSMPFEQWLPVLMAVWGQYFLYLTGLHTVMDYIISKLLPTQPQGLATKFLTSKGRMEFSRK